ncbi:MAG: glycerol-3-phosphate dehydrogenase/oxidase [Rhodocyclaceae bacterium]|nr:glycerol-3-phosphate dehydrogenase/oxidase [Rhodocyclaceae bacterium]
MTGRVELLAALRNGCSAGRPWDVAVVGGGATGLGCAVDAASRGYSTVLVEAHDFAKGTSSRATKLVHGGVRYLAQGNLSLVREALSERAVLLANAPHLVRPLRFVVPTYHWHQIPMLGAGLGFYDLLAGRHSLGRSRVLGRAATCEALPGVRRDGLRGGIAYWDAQFDDAGLAIALARTVEDLGALPLNYMVVEGLAKSSGRICGVEARDVETGERHAIPARCVINATGVWADGLRRMDLPGSRALIRPSQGVHLVVDADFLPGSDALLVPDTADGRVLFVIPWLGKLVIGTTDTPRDELPLEPRPLQAEIDFILDTAARYLARAPRREDVRSTFAGLRPLVGGDGSDTADLSREHLVEVSESGLVTITGGKWTTYRRMAIDAVDAAARAGNLPIRASASRRQRLHGAGRDDARSRLARAQAVPDEAGIRLAVESEYARSVEDVLARRYRTLFLDAARACAEAPRVARTMADVLGRDSAWVRAQVTEFEALAAGYRVVGDAPAGRQAADP